MGNIFCCVFKSPDTSKNTNQGTTCANQTQHVAPTMEKDSEKMESGASSQLQLTDLPPTLLWHLTTYLDTEDVINFGMVNDWVGSVAEHALIKLDLSDFYDLKEEYLFKILRNKMCTSLSLNRNKWISEDTALKLISLAPNIKKLDLLKFKCSEKLIPAIVTLQLSSLAFTWSHEWFAFLRDHPGHSASFFKHLKTLKLGYCKKKQTDFFIKSASQHVLNFCSSLKKLEIEAATMCSSSVELWSEPWPECIVVPNLKELVVNFDYRLAKKDDDTPGEESPIVHLVELITSNEQNSLDYVYFGNELLFLLKDLQRIESLPLEHPSKFCLNRAICSGRDWEHENWNQSYWLEHDKVRSMLNKRNYKCYEMQWLTYEKFSKIASLIVDKSRQSVEELNFESSVVDNSFYLGIQLIAANCTQLTHLNIDFVTYEEEINNQRSEFPSFEENEALLDALSTLIHLKTLGLSASTLSCFVSEENDFENVTNSPRVSFYKVTKKCANLQRLSIYGIRDERITHHETLRDIRHCSNLLDLQIHCLWVKGDFNFFKDITKNCKKLEKLHVSWLRAYDKDVKFDVVLVESLQHLKFIKELSLTGVLDLTESFVDSVCTCITLQKFHFCSVEHRVNNLDYFAANLLKLKNLRKLSMILRGHDETECQNFKNKLAEIQKMNPRLDFNKCIQL